MNEILLWDALQIAAFVFAGMMVGIGLGTLAARSFDVFTDWWRGR